MASCVAWQTKLNIHIQAASLAFQERYPVILSNADLQKHIVRSFQDTLEAFHAEENRDDAHDAHDDDDKDDDVMGGVFPFALPNSTHDTPTTSSVSNTTHLLKFILIHACPTTRRLISTCRHSILLSMVVVLGHTEMISWSIAGAGVWSIFEDRRGQKNPQQRQFWFGILVLVNLSLSWIYRWHLSTVTGTSLSFVPLIVLVALVLGHVHDESFPNVTGCQNNSVPAAAHVKQETTPTLDSINRLVEISWSVVKHTLELTIVQLANEILRENTPSFVSTLELSTCEIGCQVPYIEAVDVHQNFSSSSSSENNNHVVVLDLTLRWHNAPNIQLRAASSGRLVQSNLELVEIELRGVLRLEFILDDWPEGRPDWPCFSALRVGFTQVPQLKLRLTGPMKLDVTSVPLVSEWLHALLTRLIQSHCTYPNVTTCPDWRCDRKKTSRTPTIDEASFGPLLLGESEKTKVETVLGLLIVHVDQVYPRSRSAVDSTTYCELTLQDMSQKFRTRDSMEAKWHERFCFLIHDRGLLNIRVKRRQAKKKQQPRPHTFTCVGFQQVKLDELLHSKEIQIPLLASSGFVSLTCEWKALEKDERCPVLHPPRARASSPGVLIITLLYGLNFKVNCAPSRVHFSMLCPSSSYRTSTSTKKTSHWARNAMNPKWHERFYFVIQDPGDNLARLEAKVSYQSSKSRGEEIYGGHGHVRLAQIRHTDACDRMWHLSLDDGFPGTLVLHCSWRKLSSR